MIAAGFPTKYPNREFVYEVGIPKFFVQSTHDEYGPRPQFQEFFDSLPEPKQLTWVEAEDHFFRNNLDAYEGEILRIGNSRQGAASQ